MKKRIKYAERKKSFHRTFRSKKEFETLKKKLRQDGYMIMSSGLAKNGKGYIHAYAYISIKRL